MTRTNPLPILAWLCLFPASVCIISCNDNDDENPPPSGSRTVLVNYDIMQPRTWDADSIYIVDHEVKIDASLTIEPGAIIKFKAGTGLEVWNNGTINANGTALKNIVFTSWKDDSQGGDNNGDGTASSPGKGDWTNIDLWSSSGSVFKYCHFAFGGDDAYAGVLDLGTNSQLVNHCVFANNDGYVSSGEFWGALYAGSAHKNTVITNNTFYGNTVPLTIYTEISLDNSNTFAKSGEEGNTYNGIFITGQDIEANVSWTETEVAYVIQEYFYEIWSGFTLTLGNNVVLKFLNNGSMVIHTSSQLSNGQGSSVYFTSFKDDSKKGDTNGDGTASTPTATDWYGIFNQELSAYYTWSNIMYSRNSD
jgi:hypothetical protein